MVDNYIRMSNLVCYVFYKNIMGSICMFWFNSYNGFSGQKLFTETAIQMFNLIFTSIPILLYGVYDRDIPIELVRKFPHVYTEGKDNKFFNTKLFWSWMITALWQSIVLCIVPFQFLVNQGNNGDDESFWGPGALGYTALIFTVNYKLFSFQSIWHWGQYAVLFLSIGLWFAFAYAINQSIALSIYDWYHVFDQVLAHGAFWAGLVWIVVFFQLFETTFHGFLRAYYPTNDHILQECDPQDYAENNDKNVKNDSGKEPLLTDVEMKGFTKV